MSGMDQAAFHADELRMQEDIELALRHAEEGKATKDDILLLAWASGVKYQLREKSNGKY